MIRLHQYPAIPGFSSLSPFCMKVEAFLKHNQLPYQVVTELSPLRGPKGKMPFIEMEGETITDSSFILSWLESRFGIPRSVSPEGHAIQKMVEENLYWVILHSRWGSPEGWQYVRNQFSVLFPWRLGAVALPLIRRRLLRELYIQGIGRHSSEEIYAIGKSDIDCLSSFLGSKPYFLGDCWTALDATTYSFIKLILEAPYSNPLKEAGREHKNLVNYCNRLDIDLQ